MYDNMNETYFTYYKINKGDTIYAIARKYNINPKLLAALNGLNNADYIYENQLIMIPKPNYSYYITKEGDTLDLVAQTFGIDPIKLSEYNKTVYLQEGQMLVNKKSEY